MVSKATQIKLTYFNVTALAEPIRILLHYGGKEFEDYRFEREDWPKLKPSMPLGVVPVLDIDGKRIHQSIAMTRYLAREFGLYGKDSWEALQIDMALDTINDLRQKLATAWYDPDEEQKKKKMETALKEHLPYYLEKLDELAKENNGYFANKSLSMADVFFIGMLDYLNFMCGKNITDEYENLKKLVKNVMSVPKIKEWFEIRPKTEV